LPAGKYPRKSNKNKAIIHNSRSDAFAYSFALINRAVPFSCFSLTPTLPLPRQGGGEVLFTPIKGGEDILFSSLRGQKIFYFSPSRGGNICFLLSRRKEYFIYLCQGR
jgi:hypothetical protein